MRLAATGVATRSYPLRLERVEPPWQLSRWSGSALDSFGTSIWVRVRGGFGAADTPPPVTRDPGHLLGKSLCELCFHWASPCRRRAGTQCEGGYKNTKCSGAALLGLSTITNELNVDAALE